MKWRTVFVVGLVLGLLWLSCLEPQERRRVLAEGLVRAARVVECWAAQAAKLAADWNDRVPEKAPSP